MPPVLYHLLKAAGTTLQVVYFACPRATRKTAARISKYILGVADNWENLKEYKVVSLIKVPCRLVR